MNELTDNNANENNASITQRPALDVLYQDEYMIAVNKPSGLLVHRSWIDKEATEFAMQRVRDQIGQYVYPVHRLDRPTSGVLIMGLSSTIAKTLCQTIESRNMHKQYLAITRGYTPESVDIDYPLIEQLDKVADRNVSQPAEAKSAFSRLETLSKATLPIEINRYPTSRFSLVRMFPTEGRKHQIRRHLAHLRYPIIGDVNYGDNKYNRFLRNEISQFRLALHAEQVNIPHPITGQILKIKAPIDASFANMLQYTQLSL